MVVREGSPSRSDAWKATIIEDNLNGKKVGKRQKKKRSKSASQQRRFADIAPNTDENLYETNLEGLILNLPKNQYDCVLRRRAIRKKDISKKKYQQGIDDSRSIPHPHKRSIFSVRQKSQSGVGPHKTVQDDSDSDEEEVEGEISLGMKFCFRSGKVIVQKLIPLQDGRASPAQLCGLISEGDVLISIEGRSIIRLEDDMKEMLKPLSSPDKDGFYKRSLKLRFAVGEGLKYLEKNHVTPVDDTTKERSELKSTSSRGQDGAGDLFNLFTTVDHMSGLPLFEENDLVQNNTNDEMPKTEEKKNENSQLNTVTTVSTSSFKQVSQPICPISISKAISILTALESQSDKIKHISGFYVMNDHFPALLRSVEVRIGNEVSIQSSSRKSVKTVNLVDSRRALLGAKILCDEAEYGRKKKAKVDPLDIVRSECRSFSSRSRFSQRSAFDLEADNSDKCASDDSMVSTEIENDLNGDEMLLQLAVSNKEWKNQIVEALEAASIKNMSMDELDGETDENSPTIQLQLQSFFLGEQVSQIMKEKKTLALPPEEMTAVLFDLASTISVTVPSNIVLGELNHKYTAQTSSGTVREEISEACQFMLDKVLPTWLDTFRPLPLEQRHIIWPLIKDQSMAATPDDISLSNASAATGWSGGTGHSLSTPERRKKLEEQIADLELNAEARMETCYLVTFYFSRKLLPEIQLKYKKFTSDDALLSATDAERDAVEFIAKYGSYLKLHTCLVSASDIRAETVLQSLLNLANDHDLYHQDRMKLFTRSSAIVIYEPNLLSSLLMYLSQLLKEMKHRPNMVSLLMEAYPDIKAWQVRKAISHLDIEVESVLKDNDTNGVESKEIVFYYDYLSLLLDSNECARRESNLVREWCILSTSKLLKFDHAKRLLNFVKVASKQGREKQNYHRDLHFLIDLSMKISNHILVLELATEIIYNAKDYSDSKIFLQTLSYLRHISAILIKDSHKDQQHSIDVISIRQIIILIQEMGESSWELCRGSVSMVDEFLGILELCDDVGDIDEDSANQSRNLTHKEKSFLNLIADNAPPHDVLTVLSRWSKTNLSSAFIYQILRTCVKRGVEDGVNKEISGALLRIQKVRSDKRSISNVNTIGSIERKEEGIWKNVLQGTVMIDK